MRSRVVTNPVRISTDVVANFVIPLQLGVVCGLTVDGGELRLEDEMRLDFVGDVDEVDCRNGLLNELNPPPDHSVGGLVSSTRY